MKDTKSFREYLEGTSLFKFDETTGQVIPQTSDLLEIWTVIVANIFGIPELDLSKKFTDATPFGRLVEALAIRDQRACAITAAHANQINPYYATGQALDAIASFFNVSRNGATPTKISVNISGTPNTLIPSGSKIKNAKGQTFSLDSNVTIPAGGSTVGYATSEERGKIDFEIGSVQTIVDKVAGWSQVVDTGIVFAGYDIETDNGLRSRILNARWSGTGFVESIRSAILRVDGIRSAVVIENPNSLDKYLAENGKMYGHTTISTDDPKKWPDEDVVPTGMNYIVINKNSILVVADIDDHNRHDVAMAVFNNKSAGCGYTSIKDHAMNIPVRDGNVEYNVVINTPIEKEFSVTVKVRKNMYTGSVDDLTAEVERAVNAWARGEVPNIEGLTIGQSVYPFEIGAAVSDLIKSIQVVDVSLKMGSSSVSSISMSVSEIGKLTTITAEVV